MIGGIQMNKDDELRLDVMQELKRERKISNTNRIEVTVKDGVVTLSGKVDHYMDQLVMVEAAERVIGVKGVLQETEVEIPAASKRNDIEIFRSATMAIEQNSLIPSDHLKVAVKDGKVKLDGEVQEQDQKIEAGLTVSKILGVAGVINDIIVKPIVKPNDVTLQIERRFQHLAMHHAQEIQVEIKGSKVILSGEVRAWIEKADAEDAARELPGVTEVENRLELTPLLKGKEKPPATA
jgi:osmotically-inducible protein OsmY